ncbi:M20/M25/M40 family metallo-hydrolase [Kocuria sp. U4B]
MVADHEHSLVPVEALRSSVDAGFETALADLGRLVAIPGIAWPAYDPAELDRGADLVAELLTSTGLDEVRILRATTEAGDPGAPAVLARRPAAEGAPTVLLYAHHDVQPAGNPQHWASCPFTATERDGRLYGRGVADDKAGIMLHVAALRAVHDVLGEDLRLGITVFIEGEEETGSPTLPALFAEHQELLRADVVVVADSGNWQVGVPALTTSLRGLVDGTVEVRALSHGLHSGTYGGPALDALTLLGRLIATFHDEHGDVAVEGLVGSDKTEVELDEDQFRTDAAVPNRVRLAGTGPLTARLWTKPALAVVSIDAPATAVAANTLQPVARAKISLRIPPGNDPTHALDVLGRHVQAHAPFGAEVRFLPGAAGRPFAADPDSPAARAMHWAMEQAWGVPAVDMGVGGSIPIVAELARLFPDAQFLITGAEDPDTRAHGVDESLDLTDLRRGMLAEALLLARLDRQP